MNKHIISAVLCVLALAGCRTAPPKETLVATLDGFTQGTYYHIVYTSTDTVGVRGAVDSLLQVIDNSMSVFNPSSRLSQLNANTTDITDPMIAYCITEAQQVSRLSDGMYDITVMPLVEAWGFAAKEQGGEPNVDSLLQFVGYDKIRLEGERLIKTDPRVRIDLNSIAKGYSADLVGGLLESRGIDNYLVEIGGEIMVKGNSPRHTPWAVGIDNPVEGNMVAGEQTRLAVALTNHGMATSGNYRNYRYDDKGRKIVHTINPKTGQARQSDVLSASVIAPTCAQADAMATAMVAMGAEKAIAMAQAEASVWVCIIYLDADGNEKSYLSPELEKNIIR